MTTEPDETTAEKLTGAGTLTADGPLGILQGKPVAKWTVDDWERAAWLGHKIAEASPALTLMGI